MENYYLGIDVGSISTNIVLINDNKTIVDKLYLRTNAKPISVIKKGLRKIEKNNKNIKINGVGCTGSARRLTSLIVGADVIKNEITAHAVAASNKINGVKTVLEIGGQDSKIIILRDGVVVDFAMNTVCAAGTGSFLDQQANRLGIDIKNFGKIALKSNNTVRIAGRCSVFAESDMIHKQQLGHNKEDIIAGLCEALVRNYLNNVGKGKDIKPPIVFQGGVAANQGIKKAFEKELNYKITVPDHHNVMGAIGSAILARERVGNKKTTNFNGFNIKNIDYDVSSFECEHCSNNCEIINIKEDGDIIACLGSKCNKWEVV